MVWSRSRKSGVNVQTVVLTRVAFLAFNRDAIYCNDEVVKTGRFVVPALTYCCMNVALAGHGYQGHTMTGNSWQQMTLTEILL